ncbi:hypothetical protein V7147_10615 [Bacillus sp. JJ1521]|uniref:hypothetical protein n=1 Tax=Bacillus sp. JJ1521 TaxID=3122957 RepID=UPI002FFEDCFC
MKIVLKQLNVEKVSDSSGIFSGENLQIDWKSYKKMNEGFGLMLGNHNQSTKNYHIVQKKDFEEKSIHKVENE